MSKANSLQLIQKFAKVMTESGFDRVLQKVNIVSAGEGKCRAEMVVSADDVNKHGTLHGGMIATLVDVISTYAVMTQGSNASGVSVDIHVQYLKAVQQGEEIVLDATTMRAGKRLAFLEVDITNKATGSLLAKGTHTKFVG